MPRIVLLRTADPLVARRAAGVVEQMGLQAVLIDPASGQPIEPVGAGTVVGLLAELGLNGAIEAIERTRTQDADCTIVAFLSLPEPDLWSRAEEAGADEVTTRGRADRALATHLDDRLSGRRRARRLRLAPFSEFAGRLGHVGRIEETPAGPIALYHLSGRLYAISDSCPHAGASLCEGELDGDVVTCPRHGSQFRVTDGARLRGPADLEVQTFPVVIDSGDAFLELPE